MEIRSLDLSDDEAMRRAYEVQRRSSLLGREGMPVGSELDFVGNARSVDRGERQLHLVAVDSSGTLGVLSAWFFLLDNTDKVWFELHVDPTARGRGVGSALLDRIEQLAIEDGRTQAMTDLKLPFEETETHPDRRFAAARGYDLANIEVVRHLALPILDSTIRAWEDRAAGSHDGYRFETLVDTVPEQYAESLCVLLGQLAVDAPSGAVDYEEEVITPERLAEMRATTTAMGRIVLETVALDPEDRVVAQTTLAVPTSGTDVWQWGTFVHREHRGHRLGLAVKTANLRALQQRFPGMARVSTQNGETNAHMVSINSLLGFEAVEESVEVFKTLSGPG